MTLRLNPRVTGTDRSCGHVQGTARTLFDYAEDVRIMSGSSVRWWLMIGAVHCWTLLYCLRLGRCREYGGTSGAQDDLAYGKPFAREQGPTHHHDRRDPARPGAWTTLIGAWPGPACPSARPS